MCRSIIIPIILIVNWECELYSADRHKHKNRIRWMSLHFQWSVKLQLKFNLSFFSTDLIFFLLSVYSFWMRVTPKEWNSIKYFIDVAQRVLSYWVQLQIKNCKLVSLFVNVINRTWWTKKKSSFLDFTCSGQIHGCHSSSEINDWRIFSQKKNKHRILITLRNNWHVTKSLCEWVGNGN